ncbi:MAG: helix-turn-helix transcriptional regulator [Clostridia bacterium]|nr:helix-turn-helix transcriptional regulator [Clostridia bacterium]
MEFREKLKKLRVSKNLSQQALADAIFVSRSAVAKWEAGLGMPSFDSLLALERYFGVEEGYFLTDKPDEVIVKKNIAVRRLWTAVGVASFVFLFLFSVLLMV